MKVQTDDDVLLVAKGSNERERVFRFQSSTEESTERRKQPSNREESKHDNRALQDTDELTEEEEKILLEMVMRQSLVEYNEKDGTESKDGGDDQESVQEETRRELSESSKPVSPSLSPSSARDFQSSRVRTSISLLPAAESILQSPTSTRPRPTLEDRDFSRRTLREIERTETVVDSPHADAALRRRRLSKSESLNLHATLGTAGLGAATRSSSARVMDTGMARRASMDEAKKHLSSQEIIEIERALRDADASEAQQLLETPRPLRPPAADLKPATDVLLSPRGDANKSPRIYSTIVTSPRTPRTPRTVGKLPPKQTIDRSRLGIPLTPATPMSSPKPQLSVASYPNTPASKESTARDNVGISDDEAAAIQAALHEADAKEEAESLMLAFKMQQEELTQVQKQEQQAPFRSPSQIGRGIVGIGINHESPCGSVPYSEKSLSPYRVGAVHSIEPPRLHPLEQQEISPSQRGRFRGPGVVQESRPPTRHPLEEEEGSLDSNSRTLGSGSNNSGRSSQVSNRYRRRRSGSDDDALKAMDPHDRLQVHRATDAGWINRCNGAVKQGREAIVYYANEGPRSHGFDVAVKVYKRLQDFQSRGKFVDGDPRYAGSAFGMLTVREQLEVWTEKEFQNLIQADRAQVPVPTPLHYKENVIFMRFMGNNGWPSPQIREIQMEQGIKKWDVLYTQVMEAVRR